MIQRERKVVSAVEGTSVPLACYLTDSAGNAATQADFAGGSISYMVVNEAGTVITPSTGLTVANVISDTVLTVGWEDELPGYNFDHVITPAEIPDADTYYDVDYKFVMSDGYTDIALFRIETIAAGIT
jgi:hypothetical protein